MSQAESESADADTDSGFTYHAQVTQHPLTIIEGEITDIMTGADLDGDTENNSSSFGIIIKNPSVPEGSIWQNSDVPEGFGTVAEFNDALKVAINGDDLDYVRGQEVDDDFIETARERVGDVLDVDDFEGLDYDEHQINGTDFKIADVDDRDSSIGYNQHGEQTGIDVGGGEFSSSEVDEFGVDSVMVWYGGMSGQFIGRALDYNGLPFARYTDDGYLVKGLYQAPIGWRSNDSEEYDRDVPSRNDLKFDIERYPRVARPPILRDDLEGRSFIAVGRYNGGDGLEGWVGRSMDSYTEVVEAIADDVGRDELPFDPLDMKYEGDRPDERLNEFANPDEVYTLYHGEGWQDEPDNAQSISADGDGGDNGGSFDVPSDDNDDAIEHPTDEEETFAKTVSEQITGAVNDDGEQATPDEAFSEQGGLEGVVESNAGNFDNETDLEAIRTAIYTYTDELSADDA